MSTIVHRNKNPVRQALLSLSGIDAITRIIGFLKINPTTEDRDKMKELLDQGHPKAMIKFTIDKYNSELRDDIKQNIVSELISTLVSKNIESIGSKAISLYTDGIFETGLSSIVQGAMEYENIAMEMIIENSAEALSAYMTELIGDGLGSAIISGLTSGATLSTEIILTSISEAIGMDLLASESAVLATDLLIGVIEITSMPIVGLGLFVLTIVGSIIYEKIKHDNYIREHGVDLASLPDSPEVYIRKYLQIEKEADGYMVLTPDKDYAIGKRLYKLKKNIDIANKAIKGMIHFYTRFKKEVLNTKQPFKAEPLLTFGSVLHHKPDPYRKFSDVIDEDIIDHRHNQVTHDPEYTAWFKRQTDLNNELVGLHIVQWSEFYNLKKAEYIHEDVLALKVILLKQVDENGRDKASKDFFNKYGDGGFQIPILPAEHQDHDYAQFKLGLAKHLLLFASRVYDDDGLGENKIIDKEYTIKWFRSSLGVQALVAYSKKNNAIVVSCRGTSSIKEALIDVNFMPRFIQLSKLHRTPYMVHSGFWMSASILVHGIASEVDRLMNKYSRRPPLLFHTGHSLGGFVQLLPLMPKVYKWKPTASYTFGSPKFGDANLAKVYNSIFPNTFRVQNKNDSVPYMPPSALGLFKQVGRMFFLHEDGSFDYTKDKFMEASASASLITRFKDGDKSIIHPRTTYKHNLDLVKLNDELILTKVPPQETNIIDDQPLDKKLTEFLEANKTSYNKDILETIDADYDKANMDKVVKNFYDDITGNLGITKDRIKIISVSRGSIKILFQILGIIPVDATHGTAFNYNHKHEKIAHRLSKMSIIEIPLNMSGLYLVEMLVSN